MKKISILKNPVQNYAWGSMTFIQQIMGDPVSADKPQAELWMGVHSKAPSQVLFAKKFSNKLPFLFKVLAAAKPLSIQAHPNRDQAREGFARENEMKISLDAPNRNYRDENHKPEMICALTPFWVLSGFRRIGDVIELAERIAAPDLKDKLLPLRGEPEAEGLKEFFTTLMTMDKGAQRQLVSQVVDYSERPSATHGILEWVMKLHQAYPGDIGVLSPIFMNVLRLEPGEALYTPTGRLHAYLEGAGMEHLEGAGMELMANSDNVLRGGLTAKNIDVPALLKILNFTHNEVDILEPERRQSGENIYRTPAKEFSLSVISVGKGSIFESPQKRSVEIMACLEGDALVTDLGNGEDLSLTKGAVIIIPAAVENYRIEGDATLYKASVPP
jgi:mannose-6-phosphate isomerase